LPELTKDVVIKRQPVLTGKGSVFGYDISFSTLDIDILLPHELVGFLQTHDLQNTTRGKPTFFNLDEHLLTEEVLDVVENEKGILNITSKMSEGQLINTLKHLKKYPLIKLSINYYPYNDLHSISSYLDYMKIDISNKTEQEIIGIIKQLDRSKLQLIATSVDRKEDFDKALNLGFSYFIGTFFIKDDIFKLGSPDKAVLIELYRKLKNDANINEIEEIFKKNPDLSYKLLQYVNSPYFYFRSKVTSIRHAIALLGLRELTKVVLITLYSGNSGGANNPIFEIAAIRGKFMEVLAEKAFGYSKNEKDEAFLTGMLSLANIVLQMSVEELAEKFKLEDEIVKALKTRDGKYGPLLRIIEILEKTDETDTKTLTDIANRYNVSLKDILDAEMEAYAWVEGIL